ncbi:glycosyltransferase family 39 protein [Cokeromyces recurvatus]|uniref:glycosyltransferase family 39 protein n=1 Tax=Cokeromyces recurvatus TaxID=90255 RepID=UPI002220F439|nr:glycosyltransferase family 39 protein [Cokeromyces recurvatus]KAI7897500.1 glycosyltransferase family 39 protein [Cokeromyces recurvatus]
MVVEEKKTKIHKITIFQKRIDWVISIILTIWTCYIRLWRISQPSSVVFDEVHFGGFASKYINKKFFMDVHPPLAKLLITWAAEIVGFDGQFDFKEIGKDYLKPKVPYVQIRAFCALNGVMVVPIAYWTMRNSGFSRPTAILTALMICYENSLITNNRLILLDSILLYFIAFTLLMWINFRNQANQRYKFWWWIWLILTGVGIGLTVSCKWVGLFTMATIGLAVIKNLWDLWGNQKIKVIELVKHFLAYFICLILIPFIIYATCFEIHFNMLPLSGTGTSHMSSEFQTSLQGVKFPESTFADIVYGAKISIKHMGTNGGYLHSHEHSYPGGSNQQQVTLYSHIDDNNWWIINKADTDDVNDLEYVKHGDIVRLTHLKTHRRLHTHDIRPITNDEKYQYEVSSYGFKGFQGDSNDNWRVEIINYDGPDPFAGERLRARRSQFRLVSVTQNCALFSRKFKLPEWGFKQQEVTCMRDALYPKTIWRIESTESDLLPENAEVVEYEHKGFFGKFLELNKVMWNVNKGLSSVHMYGSRPKDWPLLKRGISFWSKDHLRVYLLGNPLIYWVSTACVFTYVMYKVFIFVLAKRCISIPLQVNLSRYDSIMGFFFISWALHYFPFNLMKRQLFLHHYMPSLYMAVLMSGVFFELFTSKFSTPARWSFMIVCIMMIVYVYRIFIPIIYAEPWSKENCLKATWRSTWDLRCEW